MLVITLLSLLIAVPLLLWWKPWKDSNATKVEKKISNNKLQIPIDECESNLEENL